MKFSFESFPCVFWISFLVFSISLESRDRSASKSTSPAIGMKISNFPATVFAQFSGASPFSLISKFSTFASNFKTAISDLMIASSEASPRKRASIFFPGGTFISPRKFRKAVATSTINFISFSTESSNHFSSTSGNSAMIKSGSFSDFIFCQISSVANGV